MLKPKQKAKNVFCRTKIICTLGPACDDEGILEQLIQEGLDGGRFNFSHGTHPQHLERIQRFRKVCKKLGVNIPCILDTKGPEIRLGTFKEPVILEEKQKFTITTKEAEGTKEIASVSHKGITKDLKKGDRVLIDDGLVELVVDDLTETDVICTVLNTGKVNSNKGVNLPGIKTSLPSLTEKDIGDLKFGVENGFDYVAASFVRTKEDCVNIKKYLKDFGGPHIKLIAKIENQEGIDNLDDILTVADGLMVARGDLGVEIPVERIPIEQKKMIKKCVEKRKLVITATQMLDSMIVNPRPTRAEVTDIANAIIDGTSVVMLSGETASGKHPIEAVRYMNSICLETEKNLDLSNLSNKWEEYKLKNFSKLEDFRDCICYSVCCTANIMKVNAIICVTGTGAKAISLSNFRSNAPIFAVTYDEQTAKFLSLEWNIQPVLVEKGSKTSHEMILEGIEKYKNLGFLKKGDTVAVAGEPSEPGSIKSSNAEMIGGLMTVS